LRKLSEDDFTARRADLRAHVVSQLYHLSVNAKEEKHKLKALELLGKTNLVGLYDKVPDTDRPAENDASALREKLGDIIHRLAEQAEPVEGTAIVTQRKPTGARRKAKAEAVLVPVGERKDGSVRRAKPACAVDDATTDGDTASASADAQPFTKP
jgi:hypothetical protein